jgi:hypothetical protein
MYYKWCSESTGESKWLKTDKLVFSVRTQQSDTSGCANCRLGDPQLQRCVAVDVAFIEYAKTKYENRNFL